MSNISPYPNAVHVRMRHWLNTKTPYHFCDPIYNNSITCCSLTVGIKTWKLKGSVYFAASGKSSAGLLCHSNRIQLCPHTVLSWWHYALQWTYSRVGSVYFYYASGSLVQQQRCRFGFANTGNTFCGRTFYVLLKKVLKTRHGLHFGLGLRFLGHMTKTIR